MKARLKRRHRRWGPDQIDIARQRLDFSGSVIVLPLGKVLDLRNVICLLTRTKHGMQLPSYISLLSKIWPLYIPARQYSYTKTPYDHYASPIFPSSPFPISPTIHLCTLQNVLRQSTINPKSLSFIHITANVSFHRNSLPCTFVPLPGVATISAHT